MENFVFQKHLPIADSDIFVISSYFDSILKEFLFEECKNALIQEVVQS